MDDRDKDVIALTHVCHAWREAFISRSSLWADLDCSNPGKTLVYLERSKSSPINVSLRRYGNLHIQDPFLQIVPHTTERLRYLSVEGTPGTLQDITPLLSCPTPLLEYLSIANRHKPAHHVLSSTLFNGDLSSLRHLNLGYIRTELPWRNMANLTSFKLSNAPPMPVVQVLDFFESAPHLREVGLFSTLTPSTPNGRLVSLACLKWMDIANETLCSPLLDHLLIPIGARLKIQAAFITSLIEGLLPRSLDNLMNLSGFTTIRLKVGRCPSVEFGGPRGHVTIISTTSQADNTGLALESLARFNTAKAERLDIDCGDFHSRRPPYRALLPMRNLRTITLSLCKSTYRFADALHPSMNLSGVAVCPKLEELVLNMGASDLEHVTRIVSRWYGGELNPSC